MGDAGDPTAPGLIGEWHVTHLGGVPVSGSAVPSLQFDAEGRVSGSSGVNRVVGGFTVDGDRLRLSGLVTTRMAGPPDAMEQESRLLRAIGEGGPFSIDGDELTIEGDETAGAGARLRRVVPDSVPDDQPGDQPDAEPDDVPDDDPFDGIAAPI